MKRPTNKEVLALGLVTVIKKKLKINPAAMAALEEICYENKLWRESAEREAERTFFHPEGCPECGNVEYRPVFGKCSCKCTKCGHVYG